MTPPSFGPPVPSHGPSNAKLFILAEAPGEQESARGVPLVGPSGHELRRMLATVGLNLADCYKANVFSRQPADNNLHLYGTDLPSARSRSLGPFAGNPTTYLADEHLPEIERVYAEIASVRPNLILALGNTACWALGLGLGINSLRGSIFPITIPGLEAPVKALPTYHPAAILRQWDLRVIALGDMEKARHESLTPSIHFDNTELWLNPTLEDLLRFDHDFMADARVCACDIETKRGQITAISFAPNPSVSICIPLWLEGVDPDYWSASEEPLVWSLIRKWLERPDLVKVFQNGLYDLQYLRFYCTPRACTEDTMLAHHSLYSELRKGLGFLGSVYANVPSWKSMRTWKREEQVKRDE